MVHKGYDICRLYWVISLHFKAFNMSINEVNVLVAVVEAAMNKGGVIAPDAMLAVAMARQSAIMMTKNKGDEWVLQVVKKPPEVTSADVSDMAKKK